MVTSVPVVLDSVAVGVVLSSPLTVLRWLLLIAWYQMFWDPAMAETTHRRRIKAAYLCPMRSVERTRSLPGYQLPRLPTIKGCTETSE